MPRSNFVFYTDEQKEQAREIDTLDFIAKYKGFSFQKVGKEYHCKEHNSLVINADRKKWYWNSQKVGGHDAISFLQKIENLSYAQAMGELIGSARGERTYEKVNISEKPAEEKRAFALPEATKERYKNVFAYLLKTRRLDADMVQELISAKKIYQDTNRNCVFVGFNEENKPAFACRRGTYTAPGKKPFRGDCDGSDKRYAFRLDGEDKSQVFVFEAPIDALSHATMWNEAVGDKSAYKQHTRLTMAGSSDAALEHYLKTHKEVKSIIFCLDNDDTGKDSTEKYTKKYSEQGYNVSSRPSLSKDYNSDLVAHMEAKDNARAPIIQAPQSVKSR